MNNKVRLISRITLYAAAVVYPFLVFYFLVIRKAPIRVFSLFVMAFAVVIFITTTSKKKAGKKLFP